MSLVDSIAELTNGNSEIFLSYLTNQTQSLPSPYNCIQGMIDDSKTQVNESINQFTNNITNPTSSPSSIDNCQPLIGQLEVMRFIWMDYMTNLSNFAIGNSLQYPELAPAFAADLVCEINIMLDFAANAISSLSGVDPEYISNILNGTVNPPFTPPLDCVASALMAMQNRISSLRNSFVQQIQLMATSSSGLLSEFKYKF